MTEHTLLFHHFVIQRVCSIIPKMFSNLFILLRPINFRDFRAAPSTQLAFFISLLSFCESLGLMLPNSTLHHRLIDDIQHIAENTDAPFSGTTICSVSFCEQPQCCATSLVCFSRELLCLMVSVFDSFLVLLNSTIISKTIVKCIQGAKVGDVESI